MLHIFNYKLSGLSCPVLTSFLIPFEMDKHKQAVSIHTNAEPI